MKKYIILTFFFLSMISCYTYQSQTNLSINGKFYYGKNRSFSPMPFVYAIEDNNIFYVESYKFHKSIVLLLLNDTLYSHTDSNFIYKGKRSVIYKKKNKLFYNISQNDTLRKYFEEIEIKLNPESIKHLEYIRKKAVPFNKSLKLIMEDSIKTSEDR